MLIFSTKYNRSKADIVAQILTATKKPVVKTRVMYLAYLSSVQTREYIQELISKDLLSYNNLDRTLLITKQGEKYLRLHRSMERLNNV